MQRLFYAGTEKQSDHTASLSGTVGFKHRSGSPGSNLLRQLSRALWPTLPCVQGVLWSSERPPRSEAAQTSFWVWDAAWFSVPRSPRLHSIPPQGFPELPAQPGVQRAGLRSDSWFQPSSASEPTAWDAHRGPCKVLAPSKPNGVFSLSASPHLPSKCP